MAGKEGDSKIILYHYTYSPHARRVSWYLTLRGLPYAQCLQPATLPREDINALGLSYRRIPVLAIGRDIYYDTRLILKKLEQFFPAGALGAKTSADKAIEDLLSRWATGTVFPAATNLIPTNLPLMNNEKFIKDREDFSGRSWKKEDIDRARPEAVVAVRDAFDFLESTLLADGREWILGSDKPSLADVEAVWPFNWLNALPGALPPSLISRNQFPKVFAWIDRFQAAITAAQSSGTKPITLSGADALKEITGAAFLEPNPSVDQSDPLGLEPQDFVQLYPTDTGRNHRDRGVLVGLTKDELVIECQTKMAHKTVRVHAPRSGYRIQKVTGDAAARL